jgi:hypothetical protein
MGIRNDDDILIDKVNLKLLFQCPLLTVQLRSANKISLEGFVIFQL